MNKLLCAMLVAGLGMAGSAWADEGADLAKKSGCLGCHAVDKKMTGPAYKDVAAKYKGDKKAEAALFDKVRSGGSGVWGKIAMPAQTKASDAELKTIIRWVLSQK